MCKTCYGFQDKKGGNNLIPNRERRTQGSHDCKLIIPKGHRNIFRFSFFPRTITGKKQLPVKLSLFLKVNSFRLSFTSRL